jgi:DNA-binding transcriptional MocR family regulator
MKSAMGRGFTYNIVEKLGQDIVTGAYGPQNPFPIEAELCKRLGASRSVLREAIKMLTTKGLLKARPRQGTLEEPEDNWNPLDPDVLRWLLEQNFSPGSCSNSRRSGWPSSPCWQPLQHDTTRHAGRQGRRHRGPEPDEGRGTGRG